jgi:hypothetical protein
MIVLNSTTAGRRTRLLRACALVLVCALGGGLDLLTNSFATIAARMASFPEEEEHGSKDRSSLIATIQPSRKGGIRPSAPPADRVDRHAESRLANLAQAPSTLSSHRPLTGAGIFQHC